MAILIYSRRMIAYKQSCFLVDYLESKAKQGALNGARRGHRKEPKLTPLAGAKNKALNILRGRCSADGCVGLRTV